MSQQVLELFKAVVIHPVQKIDTVTTTSEFGIITDFAPTAHQMKLIKSLYKPLDVSTLFSVKERKSAEVDDLIRKQVRHYVEVYGLNSPGLFDLEVKSGSIMKMNFIQGITEDELAEKVQKLMYSNAPIKDTPALKAIITEYMISYDINKVENNELRILLFNINNDTFDNGDDAVRWMCFTATESAMLIKSKEVIASVKAANFPVKFYERHEVQLAQVFNRHKKLIMATKNHSNKTVINRISRLSKKAHVPLHESVSKNYVVLALMNEIDPGVLDNVSVRDKFKFLNLLAYKKLKHETDAFVIRNGKIHVKNDRKVWKKSDIKRVENDILESLKSDLSHLYNTDIVLDDNVRYGLPTSRKQTIGHLPFGTRINVEGKEISSGIYWKNEWGASDLDLSTIDLSGNRTGWGDMSGYDRTNPVTFSGDLTNAYEGAMEFMTSKKSSYGLFVSIYSGETGCKSELIIGNKTKKRWIGEVQIREEMTLNSRGNLIGFVNDKEYVVYQGRMSSSHVSGDREAAVVSKGLTNFWTINKLFDKLNVKYIKKTVYNEQEAAYNTSNKSTNTVNTADLVDLSYEGFTFDKLEDLLYK